MPGSILQTDTELRALLDRTRVIAVLGIKTEAQADQPAFYVPEFAQQAGFRVIPVPVYYPEAEVILGEPVFRSLAAIGEPLDMVNVFRRAKDIDGHLDDILAARPKAVWLQLGIRHDAAAQRLVAEGIDVVQDRCLLVEIRRLRPGPT